jgi:alanyl-tRNA synthetase
LEKIRGFSSNDRIYESKELCGGILKNTAEIWHFKIISGAVAAGIRAELKPLWRCSEKFLSKSRKYFMEIKETLKNHKMF